MNCPQKLDVNLWGSDGEALVEAEVEVVTAYPSGESRAEGDGRGIRCRGWLVARLGCQVSCNRPRC